MIMLYDKLSARRIGEISEGELQFLIDELEEEDSHDQDYYIDAATIDFFVTRRANPHLVALLREALGMEDGIEIVWEDDSPDEGE
ncbi:MAG: galactosyldiacylglycerol synthase [Proteobacteria bacterium]|nr:galactosyldiacylglycerol synthase [Pseudomonadota bacterium]